MFFSQRNELLKKLNDQHAFIELLAHELRSQAGIVYTYSNESLDAFRHNSTDLENSLLSLLSVSEYLNTLVNNLLETERYRKGKLEVVPKLRTFDFGKFLNTIVTSYRLVAKSRNISILLEKDETHDVITMDYILLGQILSNLLSNAVKFTPNEGEILVRCNTDIDYIFFQIIDNGISIPIENMSLIFQPYKTLNKFSAGLGIGLYISWVLTEAIGGSIDCEKNGAKGMVFNLKVPFTRE